MGNRSGVQLLVLSQYVTSHAGQLSLAILQWVGAMSINKMVVMLCGWGVKASIVHEWVVGIHAFKRLHDYYCLNV